jgi:pimeloyl-ACP methyl ester carboxylesterase
MSTSDLTPTVVLVHGAFFDASSWNGVIAELKAAGLDVVAPPNLLRGVGVDAAYLTGFVEALGRPVVLVGHSYAGAVISQTGSDARSTSLHRSARNSSVRRPVITDRTTYACRRESRAA